MIVFKSFLKVLNACKVPIILYSVMLIIFGAMNMQNNDPSTSFTATKPDIAIINKDEEIGITKHLIEYLNATANIIELEDTIEARSDALFYRDVNYIIYIPANFRTDFWQNQDPEIQVQSTKDYQASLAQMNLEKYLKIAKNYRNNTSSEEELLAKINETLAISPEVEMTSKLDSTNLARISFYYNFLSYSLLAGCVYVICLILSSFQEEKIRKRTRISSMKIKDFNRALLFSNLSFATILWLIYVILSFILLGDILFSIHGIFYILNSFIFLICTVSLAFLIGNLVHNKEAINGIVNVVALGSSFLCGAFVPMEWLPDFVLKIAHLLPTYYFIHSNELLKTMEDFSIENLKPIFCNFGILLIFIAFYIILTNQISKRKQKID